MICRLHSVLMLNNYWILQGGSVMSRFHLIFSVLISVLLASISTTALAQDEQAKQTSTTTTTTSPSGTVIEKRVIVTTSPAPKETIPLPTGYVSCFIVKAGWNQDIWVPDHNVCTYSNSSNGLVWVEGYWTCNKYDITQGLCTNWDWKSAHWEKSVSVY
jgi:hypothetical protein